MYSSYTVGSAKNIIGASKHSSRELVLVLYLSYPNTVHFFSSKLCFIAEPTNPKPIIDTVVMSNAVHAYVSQSDKGELVIGAGTDDYVSYTQKGSHQIVEGTLNAILELYPIFSRMRMLRQWGGIVDICPDASPIISKTSIKGLYFNCGWGTGGFKATPGSGDLFAHTIANDEPHKLNAAFNINRFVSGDLVDEHGAAAVAH